MAQTFLKLDTGVTGTLPTGNYVQGSGDLVRVGGASATGQNVGHLAIDSLFSSTYRNYLVVGYINLLSDSSQIWLRYRKNSGTTLESSNYKFAFHGTNVSDSISNISSSGGDSKFRLSGGTTSNDGYPSSYFEIKVFNPAISSMITSIHATFTEFDESAVLTRYSGGGFHTETASHDGLYFVPNSQNLENYHINVYGMKDS